MLVPGDVQISAKLLQISQQLSFLHMALDVTDFIL
jgi:hypothetical protein